MRKRSVIFFAEILCFIDLVRSVFDLLRACFFRR